MRKLTLKSGIWKYKIGRSVIIIKSPDNKRTNINTTKFVNMSWEDIESFDRNGCFHITPQDIKNYIESRML